jgi:hypothetical protein
LNIFDGKVSRRILGPIYDNEKENWRILTNNEIYAMVKKPTITETVRLKRLRRFGYVQRMEENRIPKRVLYMSLETRLRGRPRNRWQDEMREVGRIVCGKGWHERVYNREGGKIVGGEGWQEKVHNREEWRKLMRTASNCHILHIPME